MNEPLLAADGGLPPTLGRQVDQLCNQFEAAWRRGERPRIEDLVARVDEPAQQLVLRELILLAIDYRRHAGQKVAA